MIDVIDKAKDLAAALRRESDRPGIDKWSAVCVAAASAIELLIAHIEATEHAERIERERLHAQQNPFGRDSTVLSIESIVDPQMLTGSALAAIAWVLYHHQGGNSPIGQPLRFALGLGANEPLPDYLQRAAKRYGESVGAADERRYAVRLAPMDGVALIAAERQRQKDVEGWTPEHDDKVSAPGNLPMAAAAYALRATHLGDHTLWPWSMDWWKPGEGITGRIRDHVKAGALLAAEIDRLQRMLAAAPSEAKP